MREGIILGIDTSNYTTSVAAITVGGGLVANIKRPLTVKAGECGLRQADAVFAHIKNLPSAMQELKEHIDGKEILAVSVSERPRNQEGSYMPCFLSGVAVAEGIASALGVDLYRVSHQCGHLMAGIYSSNRYELIERSFGAMHISGGTTELLLCKYGENGFDATIVGGTKDLNAGQVIDRVGVKMGLSFPAGPMVEKLALEYQDKPINRRPSTDGCFLNLSGLENIAEKLYEDTLDKNAVAHFVLRYLGRGIVEICQKFLEEYGDMPMLFAGGVMSNSIIKEMIDGAIKDSSFAEPSLSSDNAVGVAALGLLRYKNNTN